MKIIMLYGPSSSGKTTTINMVYDQLKKNKSTIDISPKEIVENNDFKAIIRYKSKTIAFFSRGDYSREVNRIMTDYDKQNCDVLICACNEKNILPLRRLQNVYMNVYPPINKIEANDVDNLRAMNDIMALI